MSCLRRHEASDILDRAALETPLSYFRAAWSGKEDSECEREP